MIYLIYITHIDKYVIKLAKHLNFCAKIITKQGPGTTRINGRNIINIESTKLEGSNFRLCDVTQLLLDMHKQNNSFSCYLLAFASYFF